MINKRGQLGFFTETFYRITLVVIIAIVLLGASGVVYSHHINIRDSEAMLMIREISDCLALNGVIDLDDLRNKNVFEYCGFEEHEVERFFVSVFVSIDDKEIFRSESGDSGLLWIKDIYNGIMKTGAIDRYEPGHFIESYAVLVLKDGVEKEGMMSVEVVANAEE